ncbi:MULTISPECIES: lipopolysaccharide N-acetylmannosaminouronosyltransferase [Tatumella]|uniref:lipopolysaccharide N-acetylmannosaminouronosyltransferase n=1 Tax=Tatumella TaxID=82986 RepID=UPI0004727032|nr:MULTISPECIES: lipopolysaccharide N-acetylmannosaminouronosyltransferase [Tatumella]
MSYSFAKPPYSIRGVPLYGFSSLSEFTDFLLPPQHPRCGMLVAINAEKILTAEQDPQVQAILSASEFNYADGISIVRSIRKKYPGSKVTRIAGVDLWYALMQSAGQQRIPVFLVGGQAEVLEYTCDKLRQQWAVPVAGTQDGYFTEQQTEGVIRAIAGSGAKIVTVAMGSPRQELFIRRCREIYPDALYMGVGGTYDVFSGRVKRAPLLWQKMGLEWLYRLIKQPSRWRRQLRLLRYQKYHWLGKL